jgi:two-component system, sensor histidine kinase and response regulator
LKGLVGNFNATPVEELSRAIEVKGKQKDSSRVTLIFDELNKQIEPMIAALQRYVATLPVDDET